jgi:hypothetical protein
VRLKIDENLPAEAADVYASTAMRLTLSAMKT